MLIDKHNRDILPLARELLERALDRGVLRLGVDDEVVLLRVGRVGDVLYQTHSPKSACPLSLHILRFGGSN